MAPFFLLCFHHRSKNSLALRFGAHGGEKCCLLLPLELLPEQQLCTESGNCKTVGKPLLLLREEAGNPFKARYPQSPAGRFEKLVVFFSPVAISHSPKQRQERDWLFLNSDWYLRSQSRYCFQRIHVCSLYEIQTIIKKMQLLSIFMYLKEADSKNPHAF